MSEEDPTLRRTIQDAQERLLVRYAEVKEDGRSGWRAVAEEVGVNLRFVHDFAAKGTLPADEGIRNALLSWQPKEKKPMQPKMMQLLNLLQFHHVGKDHAIKRRDLLQYLYGLEAAQDESNDNPFDREMREMIETLNRDNGALICPAPKGGYFWGQSLDEVLQAVEPRMKGARTQLVNAARLKANAKRRFGGQLGMGL